MTNQILFLTSKQIAKIKERLTRNVNVCSCSVKVKLNKSKKVLLTFNKKKDSKEWVLKKIIILCHKFNKWVITMIVCVAIYFSQLCGTPIISNNGPQFVNSSVVTCCGNSYTYSHYNQTTKQEAISQMAYLLSSLNVRGGEFPPKADGFKPEAKPMSPYGRPRVNKFQENGLFGPSGLNPNLAPLGPNWTSGITGNGVSKPPGAPGPAYLSRSVTALSAKNSLDGNNNNAMQNSSGQFHQDSQLSKEQKRNSYTKDSSVFKDLNGESHVIHTGQTGKKTKSHGELAGLEINANGKTPSTPENKRLYHKYVLDECKRLGADKRAIYPNVDYTTRNQPTRSVKVFFDKETSHSHLFKQELDHQGNHQWITMMQLDDNQRANLLEDNSIGSNYKKLHEENKNND